MLILADHMSSPARQPTHRCHTGSELRTIYIINDAMLPYLQV